MESQKQRLHKLCMERIEETISSVRQSIAEALAAQSGDTKSSAGDKFETTREMMAQEIDKNSALLEKYIAEKNRLSSLADHNHSGSVRAGNLVKTNHGHFYLGPSIGALMLDGVQFRTVSMYSPIGKTMLGKIKGERFQFHDKDYEIVEIL
jgi:transcription elongation GreA/GreB family factor